MIVKQLSVFLENKNGRLLQAANVLAENGVDISALALAESSEFGVVRMIVNDPEKGREALTKSGVTVRISRVIAVAMDDVPGGLVGILAFFSDAGINVEYMYACVGKVSGKALMIFRPDDVEKAEQTLKAKNLDNVNPQDVYRI